MYAELKLKVCSSCKVAKERKEFSKDSNKKDGLRYKCRKCTIDPRTEDRKKNPTKYRELDFATDLWKNYRITVEQYWIMYENQRGCCDMCKRHSSEFKRRLHVDHDHVTGAVRALLCTRCNPGLGYFNHSVERLESAIVYLNKFKKVG